MPAFMVAFKGAHPDLSLSKQQFNHYQPGWQDSAAKWRIMVFMSEK
jgi:hypothetical protein